MAKPSAASSTSKNNKLKSTPAVSNAEAKPFTPGVTGHPALKLLNTIEKLPRPRQQPYIHHFLSMKITRNVPNRHVFMSQSHYIDELCKRFLDGKHTSVSTPTDANFKCLHRRWPEERPSSGPYNQLIGSLLWLSQCTCPDIAFAINRLSQHLRDPSEAHWHASIRILNYLVSTKLLKLKLGGKLDCCGYSDSDWAEDRDDCRSTSAYTYCVGDGAILWKSRKQATVSLSSTEAEYKALSDSCKEGLWLRHLLTKLHL
ncbi:hypothetical protein PCASD_07296 [Puccinia coronata f. sp. avenae]|uniref:Reverse transcriptase Ty1/copia-type domain-containing protein n=1 Tax=Puccinia coronata f. sp. avenae TaxID=200324 RepID=A0A2N5URF0_9BASI|nr:hypothetical protein PCASD_07296 [Puccinia coronata f. sp. avenae]